LDAVGGQRWRRIGAGVAAFCVALLVYVATGSARAGDAPIPAQEGSDLTRLKPTAYRHRVFIFRLVGISPERIRSARLKPGGRKLGLKRVRRAARRGRLRVRRAEFRPLPSRRLGPRHRARYRLLLRLKPILPPERPPQLFSPDSFWNAPLAANAPLDPQSAALSNELRAEADQDVASGSGPWIETNSYTTPLYIASPDQPTTRVELLDDSFDPNGSLQAAFQAVPIPPGARPAEGTDAHMTIWQPSSDKLWEFWQAKKTPQGSWQAHWGGAMQNVSQSAGYYSRDSWPGAASNWGATATSLPVIGGVMRLDELSRGRVDHALALNIPAPRATVFSWPAQRTDGYISSANAIPEGARFRLDPNLNVAALGLPPLVRMMAEAAQRYGMVVRDKSGGALGFFVEHTGANGKPDPFWDAEGNPRPDGYLDGTWPSPLLAKFPWDHLQLLEMRLCTAEPCPPRRPEGHA
jgi:hypothetical protein